MPRSTLTDVANNHTQTATSNGQGIYFFEALPADTFRLLVAAKGFASKTLTDVTIIPEQPNTLNIQLALGTTERIRDGQCRHRAGARYDHG